MPSFRLDQEIEMKVWDLGYTTADAAGYPRSRTKQKEAKPLAATAFVAGFMGGAFLGKLPAWIEGAFEQDIVCWIRAGYEASLSLNGQYVGMPYEANVGDETNRGGGIAVILSIGAGVAASSEDESVEMVRGSLSDEIWRPIIYYPGGFVSNQGKVRDWKDFRKARISPSHVYPHVEVPYGGSKLVHRVVAETWLGPCQKGMFICHNNDDKLDCRVVNLRYDTPAENVRDRARNRRSRGDG